MSEQKSTKSEVSILRAAAISRLRSRREDVKKNYIENLLACGPNQHADDYLGMIEKLDKHIAALEALK